MFDYNDSIEGMYKRILITSLVSVAWFCVLVFVDELLLQLFYLVFGALDYSGVFPSVVIIFNLVNL